MTTTTNTTNETPKIDPLAPIRDLPDHYIGQHRYGAPRDVEIHLSAYSADARFTADALARKVREAGGRYSDVRGHASKRYVTIPLTHPELIDTVVRKYGGATRKLTMIVRGGCADLGPAWINVTHVDGSLPSPLFACLDKLRANLRNAVERGIATTDSSKYDAAEQARVDAAARRGRCDVLATELSRAGIAAGHNGRDVTIGPDEAARVVEMDRALRLVLAIADNPESCPDDAIKLGPATRRQILSAIGEYL